MRSKLFKKIISFIIIPILLVLLVNSPAYASFDWYSLGGVGTYDVLEISHFVDDGIPYIAYTERGVKGITVKKYTEWPWETVGEEFATDKYVYSPTLFVRNGTPYVAYLDEINDQYSLRQVVTVKRFDGQVWENVGEPGLIPDMDYYAYSVSLYVDDYGIPYVAMCDAMTSSLKVTVMKYTGFGWEIVGDRRFSKESMSISNDKPSLYVYNGIPYVAYEYFFVENQYDYNYRLDVMGYDGIDWYSVGDMPYTPYDSADEPCLRIDDGTLYVYFNDYQNAVVLKYSGKTGNVWEKLGDIDKDIRGTYDYIRGGSFAISQGTPYAALYKGIYGGGSSLLVCKYTDEGWKEVYTVPVNFGDSFSLAGDDYSISIAGIHNTSKKALIYYGDMSQSTVNIAVTLGEGGYFQSSNTAYYTDKAFDIQSGSSLKLNFYGLSGNIISKVYIDGKLEVEKPGTAWIYTFENVTSNHIISVEYAPGYEVWAIPTGNGTITGTGFDSARYKGGYYNYESVELTANANPGYSLTYWSYWASVSGSYKEFYIFENPIAIDSTTPHFFEVRFDPYYTYTSSAGEGGSITPSADVKLTWDDESQSLYYSAKTFEITPHSGYHILDVLVDDVSVGAVQSYIFPRADLSSPPTNRTISAAFAPDGGDEGGDEDALSEIEDINSFFQEHIGEGELTGIGNNEKVAANRLNALGNMLKEAKRLIEQGDYEGAILQLQSIYKKVDGNPNPPDFVEGEARAELAQMIQDMIDLLESLLE